MPQKLFLFLMPREGNTRLVYQVKVRETLEGRVQREWKEL